MPSAGADAAFGYERFTNNIPMVRAAREIAARKIRDRTTGSQAVQRIPPAIYDDAKVGGPMEIGVASSFSRLRVLSLRSRGAIRRDGDFGADRRCADRRRSSSS